MKRILSLALVVLFCTIALFGTYASAEPQPVNPAARRATQIFLQGSELPICIVASYGDILIKGSLFYRGTSTLLPNKRIKLYKKRGTASGWSPTWTYVKTIRTTDIGQIITYVNVDSGSAWKYKAVFEGTARLAPSKNTTCYSF